MSHQRPRGLLAFMSIAVAIGMIALGLSVQNAIALGNEADQREAVRIEADILGCERGNVLRHQVIDLAEANEALVQGVLDVVFSAISNADTVDRLRDGLAPVFAEHHTAITAIELTDCPASVPGSVPRENP